MQTGSQNGGSGWVCRLKSDEDEISTYMINT